MSAARRIALAASRWAQMLSELENDHRLHGSYFAGNRVSHGILRAHLEEE